MNFSIVLDIKTSGKSFRMNSLSWQLDNVNFLVISDALSQTKQRRLTVNFVTPNYHLLRKNSGSPLDGWMTG